MIRLFLLICTALLFASEAIAACDCGLSSCTGSSVSYVMPSNTITYTFAATETCGQYVNGDYWVVDDGNVSITAMTPAYSSGSNGWMVNPVMADPISGTQTYDSTMANWDATGPPSLPYAASATESIVKTVDRGTCNSASSFHCLESVAVLTVVSSAPSTNDFRPGFYGTVKATANVSEIDWTLLPSLTPPASSDIPSLAQVASRYRWLQLDHGKTNFQARNQFATDSITSWMGGGTQLSDYGEELGHDIGQAVLRLMLDDTQAAKTEAMINVLQAGIDYYTIFSQGKGWPAEAGLMQGRKLPAVFAATMLGKTAWISDIQSASGRNYIDDTADAAPGWIPNNSWQEDGQLYFSQLADNGNGEVLWGEFKSAWTTSSFMTFIDCVHANSGNAAPCGGARQHGDPLLLVDGGSPQDTGNYQNCCSSGSYVGQALAVWLVQPLRDTWGNDDFMAYVDRWMTVGSWMSPDTAGRTVPSTGGVALSSFHGQWQAGNVDSNFVRDMWTTYRSSTPVITGSGGGGGGSGKGRVTGGGGGISLSAVSP